MNLTRVLIKNNRIHHSHKKVHQNGMGIRLHAHHSEHNPLIVPQKQHTNVNELKSALKQLSVANIPKPALKKYVSVKF